MDTATADNATTGIIGHPRGGSVDGIRKRSLKEIAATLGISDGALSKASRRYGLVFTYKGRKLELDPPEVRKVHIGGYYNNGESPKRKKPIDYTAKALAERKNYCNGVAKKGLLMRRA